MTKRSAPALGPASAVRESRCLGCADTILATSVHLCGGDRIPTKELGWYCTCFLPECRRRQQGIWPAGDNPHAR